MSGYRTRGSDRRLAAAPHSRGNLPRQSMPRNWEFYNIFGSEPVSAAGRAAQRGEDDRKKGRERRLRRWVIRLGYGGGPAASREDGYPLFESRNAPDEKCTRLKFTARKKGASDLEAYQIVIVGNRRLIYHGNASYPLSLKHRLTPRRFQLLPFPFLCEQNHGHRCGTIPPPCSLKREDLRYNRRETYAINRRIENLSRVLFPL